MPTGLRARARPRARPRRAPLLARPVALPRALRHPRLARRRGALQADRDRRRLGGACGRCSPWWSSPSCSASSPGCRATAPCPIRCWCSPACCPGSCSPACLSEASNSLVGNANLIGKVYFPRLIIPASAAVVALVDFAVNLVILVRHHGLVRGRARLADRAAPGLRRAGRAGEPRPRALPHRPQRQVPRLPLHHPVHRPVRPLRLAGRLLERGRAGGLALLVQPESDGGRHRRLPLVPAGRRKPPLPAGLPSEPRRGRRSSCGSASPISAAPSAPSPISCDARASAASP